MTDKKPPTWDSLSDKEKEEFGSKKNYGAFLRSLRSGKYDKEEEKSMTSIMLNLNKRNVGQGVMLLMVN